MHDRRSPYQLNHRGWLIITSCLTYWYLYFKSNYTYIRVMMCHILDREVWQILIKIRKAWKTNEFPPPWQPLFNSGFSLSLLNFSSEPLISKCFSKENETRCNRGTHLIRGNLHRNRKSQSLRKASVVQLRRTSSIMCVVMSSSPDWSENFPIFHIAYIWLLLSDYWGMTEWFGAHYNQEVSFSSAVKCKIGPNGPKISLLNQRQNYY